MLSRPTILYELNTRHFVQFNVFLDIFLDKYKDMHSKNKVNQTFLCTVFMLGSV